MRGLVSLMILGFLGACGAEDPVPTGSAACTGGKCDGRSVPEPLAAVPLNALVKCRSVIDDNPDEFFQLHEVWCRAEIPQGITVERLYAGAWTVDHDWRGPGSVDLSATVGEFQIARLRPADFPVRVQVTVPFATAEQDRFSAFYWGGEAELRSVADLAAWSEASPWEVGPPLELWPIAFWPSPELVSSWSEQGVLILSTDVLVPVAGSSDLAVAGPRPVTEVSNRYNLILRQSQSPDLVDVAGRTIQLLMPLSGGVDASIDITAGVRSLFGGEVATATSPLSGPGYYLVGADGRAQLTAPTSLPIYPPADPCDACGEGESCIDGACVVDPCLGACAPGEVCVEGVCSAEPCAARCTETELCIDGACVPDPCLGRCAAGETCVEGACVGPEPCGGACRQGEACVDDACVPVDACEGACVDSEACVAGACVPLAEQVQAGCGDEPSAACDVDEDQDCAEGHVCAGGLCRRRDCQYQQNCGVEPSTQRRDSFRGVPGPPICDETTDCADGHGCVDGLCRRRGCQYQQNCGIDPSEQRGDAFGERPTPPVCLADADCVEGHRCVSGFCRRLTCQRQQTCRVDPASQRGQSFDERPAPPVCVTQDHCDDGHRCREDGFCADLTCEE